MSRLEELIRSLCPNGVQHVSVSELSTRLNEKNKNRQFDKVRAVVSSGNLVDPLEIFKESVASEDKSNYLIVRQNSFVYNPARINIGSIAYSIEEEPVILSPMYIVFSLNNKKIDNKYFDYFIRSSQGKRQILSKVEEGARFRFPYETMGKIVIPLPPLEVQQEIVRILDNFSELTAELTAELEARKQQYDFYKRKLLKFDNQVYSKNKWITLSEVGKVSMCKRIMKLETTSEGDVPFYKIGTFGREPDAYISKDKFDEYKANYSYPKKGDVLISAAGTIGRTVIYNGEPAYYQDSNIVWIDNDESKVLNKYLFYCYSMKPWAISSGGTIARLYNDNINKAKIPVPPLDEQSRIVSILDRFDTLVNDIKQGLPAEIAARQKQYEYYRDKLLTFKEVGDESI